MRKKRPLFFSFICAVMLHLCLLLPFKIGLHIPTTFKHKEAVKVQLLKREDLPKILMSKKKEADKEKVGAKSKELKKIERTEEEKEFRKVVKELQKQAEMEKISKEWKEMAKELEGISNISKKLDEISKQWDQLFLIMKIIETIMVVIFFILYYGYGKYGKCLSVIRGFIKKK